MTGGSSLQTASEPAPAASRGVPAEGAPPGALRGALDGGTEGNERLTVQSGAVLLVLLALLGVTVLRIGQLLWLHLFLGLLLLGPLALKLATTGYRFAGYYLRRPAYRVKGPPPQILRLLAPLLVLDTLIVFASGIALLLAGPSSRSTLLPVHKVSFILWLGLFGLHVLGHLPELYRGLVAPRDTRAALFGAAPAAGAGRRAPSLAGHVPAARLPGSAGRGLALALALVAGLVLAVLLIPDFATWVHHGARR